MNYRPFCYASGAALLVAAFTGSALALGYVPSESQAWLSVLAIDQARGGTFVRGLHRAAAEAALVSGALAVAAALASSKSTGPTRARMGLWLLALVLVALLIVTGNPLRGDNAGHFALSTEVNVVGTLPWLGALARRALIGSGPDQTLIARMFVRHALLLPALLALALAASVFSKRRHSADSAETPGAGTNRPFVPGLADLVAMLVCVLSIGAVAFFGGAPLGAPADLESAFPARPAWYFQPLYLSRQLLPAERAPALTLLGLVALALAVAALLRPSAASASPARQRLRSLLVFGGLASYGLLAALGALRDVRDPEVAWSVRQEQWAVQRVQALSRAGASLKQGARQALNADPVHRARALFGEHCANCHALGDLGPRDGKARAPSLEGFGTAAWVMSMLDNPDAPHRFGNTPFAGQMLSMTCPPADPALRAGFQPMPMDEQRLVAEFLSSRAFPGEVTQAVTFRHEAGERIVRERCTSCHLFAGKTDDDESRAPELLGWGSPEWIFAHVLNPRSGRTYRQGPKRTGEMPGFAGVLSRDEISLLVHLVRGTLPKDAPVSGYQAQNEPESFGSE